MAAEEEKKLVIDGNAVYEIDMKCWKGKQNRQQSQQETPILSQQALKRRQRN